MCGNELISDSLQVFFFYLFFLPLQQMKPSEPAGLLSSCCPLSDIVFFPHIPKGTLARLCPVCSTAAVVVACNVHVTGEFRTKRHTKIVLI